MALLTFLEDSSSGYGKALGSGLCEWQAQTSRGSGVEIRIDDGVRVRDRAMARVNLNPSYNA